MALPATDNFNRVAPLGADWGTAYFGWGTVTIISNEVAGPAGNESLAIWVSDTPTDAQQAELIVRGMAGSDSVWGVGVRCAGSGSVARGYFAGQNESASANKNRRIYEWDDNVVATIATEAVDLAVDDLVRIEADGTGLTMYVDDTEEISGSDATFSSGAGGLLLKYAADLGDDFEVDNYSAGAVGKDGTDSGTLTGTGSVTAVEQSIYSIELTHTF